MSAQFGSVFSLISERTRWASARQAVLSHNLANADTPDYGSRDIEPFEAVLRRSIMAVEAMPVARTHQRHIDGLTPVRRSVGDRSAEAYETTPAGNEVIIEEQMQKLAATQLDHQLMTSLYSKHVAMVRTALSGPPA